jgi:hypothetical protein
MDQKAFVPNNFKRPQKIVQAHFILHPLTTKEVEKDYDAVMSSRESLRHIFYENSAGWPEEDMKLEDNYRDLEKHQQDFKNAKGLPIQWKHRMANAVWVVCISTQAGQ